MDMTPQKESILIAYTQTLHPRHTEHASLQNQLSILLAYTKQYLPQFCSKYELYFELHQSGNVHCHGILTIKDNIKRYKLLRTMNMKIGNVLFKPINDYQKWQEYCLKEKDIMEKVLNIKLPIHYPDKSKQNIIDYLKHNRIMIKYDHKIEEDTG